MTIIWALMQIINPHLVGAVDKVAYVGAPDKQEDHSGLLDQIENSISQKVLQTILIYLIVQAFVGFVAIEYAFHRTKRFR
jgi:hypothetical protein